MQKFVQTSIFYLLVSVLIMMAGIIFGYVWSSDVEKFACKLFHWELFSASTIGTVFTVLTYFLALKAYKQWKHQFLINKQHRLIELSNGLCELCELLSEYNKKLASYVNFDNDCYESTRLEFIHSAVKYEAKIMNLKVYDYLLHNKLTSDFSLSKLTMDMMDKAEIEKIKNNKDQVDMIKKTILGMMENINFVLNSINKELKNTISKFPS
ncbi:hypothetical protein [Shewanella sp. MM_2022_3]|uniref:hypothetical protein n=1 Tax=Shewanella sp. MM_2022_3 TaxID=2923280 RepID=UPI001F4C2056|nr:hypothetical protein [Shewanella sp. MM_2022_3]MCH7421292.1 hypothetical protein [Shewanella sp. MM_2022_3]